MKVNMTPNPLDVVTIHASQGDTEARQWEFELHNNGELIDTSDVTDQIVFKAYKGGTEQILPENTSTPTTSPFKGDIQYPQGLLSDQEFTYRQSPTEEDGLAFVESIKGNTLVWNQLVQNGNFESTNGWNFNNPSSASVSSNTLTVSANVDASMGFPLSRSMASTQGHKYLIMCDVRCSQANQVRVRYPFVSSAKSISANTWARFAEIGTATEGQTLVGIQENGINGATYNYKNFVCFDLTQMGLDSITSASDFTSLFPLPYYAYNQGSLLSFNGNGIKTVGKNLCTRTIQSNIYNAGNLIPVKSGDVIYYGGVWTGSSMWGAVYASKDETNKNNYLQDYNWIMSGDITSVTISRDGFFGIAFSAGVSSYNVEKMMISFVPFTMSEYEPYTSSLAELPISQYFSNGMKSAGNVYDELTETKAINRLIKTVVDGTNKTASYYGVYQNHQLFYVDLFATTYRDYSNMANLISNHYSTSSTVEMDDKYIRYQAINNQPNIGRVYWNDDRYTSASAMNTALQSSPLEIVSMAQSETVETFSVASLVTENAEIPLSNNNGVLVGKCTEQLSAEPGFHNAKIKLADADGECYSNKIQLHVERKP